MSQRLKKIPRRSSFHLLIQSAQLQCSAACRAEGCMQQQLASSTSYSSAARMPQVRFADFVEFVCVPGVGRERHSSWPSPGRQPSSLELPCCEEFEIAASTGGVEAGASILQMREPPQSVGSGIADYWPATARRGRTRGAATSEAFPDYLRAAWSPCLSYLGIAGIAFPLQRQEGTREDVVPVGISQSRLADICPSNSLPRTGTVIFTLLNVMLTSSKTRVRESVSEPRFTSSRTSHRKASC